MKSFRYDPQSIEKKWQAIWEEKSCFKTKNPGDPGFDPKQPKYYVLDMFPYPSGSGLHVGHAIGYIGTDIIARKKRMEGFNVLHPMGWDAFGLPAEQYAIQTNQHPKKTTETNSENFRRQLKLIGLSYDWTREINTSDPSYYRWTQQLFLKLFEKGLVYEKEEYVWWCEDLKTVLANEEVINGRSERGNFPCVRKPLKQWMIKITAYADRLLDDLALVDWPDSVKKMQVDWIGKSQGAELDFSVQGRNEKVRVFTTRPDTIYGVVALVIAPEHPLALALEKEGKNQGLNTYLQEARLKSELQRQAEVETMMSGSFTGAYAVHPFLDEKDPRHKVPIYVADYVLAGYGTGAVMCVPAHDERDFQFAKLFSLPVVTVIKPSNPAEAAECFTGDGIAVNSPLFDGQPVAQAKETITQEIEKRGIGKRSIKYRLRDWLFSRQRYWGEPFPLRYNEKNEVEAVPYSELPVMLPEMSDFAPSDDGSAPLARVKEWVNFVDPKTKQKYRRVTDTMPGWAGSCWYYLRFMDPRNDQAAFSNDSAKYWKEVDLYVGGVAHATMHLLYARFWHKVLFDCGLVAHPEPFKKLFNQGMVTAFAFKDSTGRLVPSDEVEPKGNDWVNKKSGEKVSRFITKMAKSLRNVVNPDDVIQRYGADTLRTFEMFMGPLNAEKPWADEGISGSHRFLHRLWNIIIDEHKGLQPQFASDNSDKQGSPEWIQIERGLNQCLKRVNDSFDNFNLNTAVAGGMEFLNLAYKNQSFVTKDQVERLVLMMSPFAPHVCEELWERLGHSESLSHAKWPAIDAQYLVDDTVEIVLSVNGKLRKRIQVPRGTDQETLKKQALQELASWVGSETVNKVIVVPNKLVNLVTK